MRQCHSLCRFCILFAVDSLDFEGNRPRFVRTAGYHLVFALPPAFHNRAALQSSIDTARNRIPDLGAERQFRTACNGISITDGLGQRVDTHVPEIVPHIIAVECKFISHVVTGAHARGRVGAILLLQLRIQFCCSEQSPFHHHSPALFKRKPPYQSIQWLL